MENLLVEGFATTKTSRNPSVAEGDLLGMAAAPRCRFCRPEELQDVLTQHVPRSHKLKQMPALTPVESLKGEEDPVGTLSP